MIMIPAASGESSAGPITISDKENSGKSELILIVEDDPSISDLAAKMIQKMGYRICLADSADRAMVMIEDEGLRPNLVITDVVMPGLSGVELAAILRFKHPSIKIMLMSGYTESVIAKHGEVDPETPFLQKPFSRSELSDKIKQALEY